MTCCCSQSVTAHIYLPWVICCFSVLVSIPKISVVQGRAVLGEPFEILCHSDIGSYPINYTLLWDYEPLNTTTVWLPKEQARFKVTIRRPEEINKFMCEAKNNLKITQDPLSKRLNATVIGNIYSLLPYLYIIQVNKLSHAADQWIN